MEDNTKTGTRAETTDRPAPQERPYTPPPDNPGSPGQPSRLESRTRAREGQQANGSQQTDVKETRSSPREERSDKPATQTETGGKKPEATSNPQATGKDQSAGNEGRSPEGTETERPGRRDREYRPPPDNPGSPGQPSRLESLARAREGQQANASQRPETDSGRGEASAERDTKPASPGPEYDDEKPAATADNNRDTDEPGVHDHPKAQAAEERTDTRASDADQPQGRDREPLPRQDRPEQSAVIGDRPSTEPPDTPYSQTDCPQPAALGNDRPDTTATQQSGNERTGREPEIPAADTGSRVDEPGDPRPADNALPSPGETDQDQGTAEPHGEHGGDRDKKTEQPDSTGPGDEHNRPDRDPAESNETEDSGRELAPHDANTEEGEEPSRFQGRISISVDNDGKPIPPSRETGNDTPDHGDPRHPEDDPASRDYRESDPEHRSRSREFLREFVTKADNTTKAADKFAEPAQKKFERVEPTGQLSGARGNNDYISPLDQPVKAGNVMLGGVGMAIVLTEAARYGIKAARRMRGSEHASN